jgi:uncharacterized tellurite resistance protein B-like protein
MIDLVKKFFGKSRSDVSGAEKETTSYDVRVATCALLLEMAHIDGEFSESEKESIINMIKEDYDLSAEHAVALIEVAGEELKGSIDLWKFAKLINQNYSTDEKIQIIEMVWRVIYTDGKIDRHEDYLVHKLAHLLRLTHKELIDAKMKILGKD